MVGVFAWMIGYEGKLCQINDIVSPMGEQIDQVPLLFYGPMKYVLGTDAAYLQMVRIGI
jgi:hypothetical protein